MLIGLDIYMTMYPPHSRLMRALPPCPFEPFELSKTPLEAKIIPLPPIHRANLTSKRKISFFRHLFHFHSPPPSFFPLSQSSLRLFRSLRTFLPMIHRHCSPFRSDPHFLILKFLYNISSVPRAVLMAQTMTKNRTFLDSLTDLASVPQLRRQYYLRVHMI